MVPEWKVRKIKELLAAKKLSQRPIAKLMRVSRGTVSAIATGRRPDYAALRRQREAEAVTVREPKGRCPQCGAKVYMPCLACDVRHKARTSPRSEDAQLCEHLGRACELRLKKDHRRRYQRLCEERMQLQGLAHEALDSCQNKVRR